MIAIIGQSYENVMDRRMEVEYEDKCDLNREAYQIMKYLPAFGEYNSNTFLLTIVNGESDQEKPNQWNGFLQTLKLFIKRSFNMSGEKSKQRIQRQILECHTKVETLKDDVTTRVDKLETEIGNVHRQVKKDSALLKSQMNEIIRILQAKKKAKKDNAG